MQLERKDRGSKPAHAAVRSGAAVLRKEENGKGGRRNYVEKKKKYHATSWSRNSNNIQNDAATSLLRRDGELAVYSRGVRAGAGGRGPWDEFGRGDVRVDDDGDGPCARAAATNEKSSGNAVGTGFFFFEIIIIYDIIFLSRSTTVDGGPTATAKKTSVALGTTVDGGMHWRSSGCGGRPAAVRTRRRVCRERLFPPTRVYAVISFSDDSAVSWVTRNRVDNFQTTINSYAQQHESRNSITST